MSIVEKIFNKIELEQEEIRDIIYGEVNGIEIVESIIEEQHRWSVLKNVIFKIENRFFRIYYFAAATEYQEDEFYNQVAEEVMKKEIKSFIWVKKEN